MLSPLISIASGSVAGLTFFRNQFHQICVRARTAPVNPKTTLQSAIRTAFSFANARWANMPQFERDRWANYAATLTFTGPLGDYTVPGRQVCIGNQSFIQYLNIRGYDTIPVLDDAPTTAGFSKFDSITTGDPAVPSVGFDLALLQSDNPQMAVLVDLSIAFNPTRERYTGPWDNTQQLYIDLASGVTGNINFTDLTDGQRYFYRVRGVTADEEHKGTAEFIGSHIAATNP